MFKFCGDSIKGQLIFEKKNKNILKINTITKLQMKKREKIMLETKSKQT